MNPTILTPQQHLFCYEYLKDFNGRAAAVRAGYAPKHAKSQARDLLKMPQVKEYLEEKQSTRSDAMQMEKLRVLQQYANIAFFNIQTLYDENGRLLPVDQLPPGAANAVASMEVRLQYDPDGAVNKSESRVVKVVPYKKMAALNALAKHLRLFDSAYQQSLRDKDKMFNAEGEEAWLESVRESVMAKREREEE